MSFSWKLYKCKTQYKIVTASGNFQCYHPLILLSSISWYYGFRLLEILTLFIWIMTIKYATTTWQNDENNVRFKVKTLLAVNTGVWSLMFFMTDFNSLRTSSSFSLTYAALQVDSSLACFSWILLQALMIRKQNVCNKIRCYYANFQWTV